MYMRYFLALFLILFLAIAVFGFVGMNHTTAMNDGKEAPGCAIPLFSSLVCVNGVIGMAIHHISAYQSFSQFQINYFGSSILLLLLSIFMAGMFLLWHKSSNFLPKYLSSFAFWHFRSPAVRHNASFKFLNWLSLFENSPSFLHKA